MIINFNLMSPKKIFIFSLLATIVVGFLFFTGTVLAQADPYGLFATADKAGLTNTGSADLPTLAGNVLGTALSFIGVLFFALMVFGGFMWMTARGNEEQTKKALSTITAAVIGLIIVLSSYTITSFVFKSVGIQSGDATPSGDVTGANAECVAFNPSFSCNEIGNCDVDVAVQTEANNTAKCTAAGTDKCVTGLCGAKTTKFCCKPKTTTVNWCYVVADKTCKTQTAMGVTCNSGIGAEVGKYYQNSTEVECYAKALTGAKCKSDSDCKNDMTKLICSILSGQIEGVCKEKTSSGHCSSSKDCVDSICKKGSCTPGVSCKPGTKIAGSDTCGDVPCGGGDSCETDSQCQSKHCVNGYCEAGTQCAECNSDGDCNPTLFCSLTSAPDSCINKKETGIGCDANNECLSGTCAANGKCI